MISIYIIPGRNATGEELENITQKLFDKLHDVDLSRILTLDIKAFASPIRSLGYGSIDPNEWGVHVYSDAEADFQKIIDALKDLGFPLLKVNVKCILTYRSEKVACG